MCLIILNSKTKRVLTRPTYNQLVVFHYEIIFGTVQKICAVKMSFQNLIWLVMYQIFFTLSFDPLLFWALTWVQDTDTGILKGVTNVIEYTWNFWNIPENLISDPKNIVKHPYPLFKGVPTGQMMNWLNIYSYLDDAVLFGVVFLTTFCLLKYNDITINLLWNWL